LTPSVQFAVVQTRLEQIVLTQSVAAAQAFEPAQREQLLAPPQSTSVSKPFFTLSLHAGTAHCPPVHTPLVQSLALVQNFVSAHLFVQLPPQSKSVSLPFFTPSEQVAVAQMLAVQTPLEQSLAAEQPAPAAQVLPGAQVPPQSTPVSVPFLTKSEQVGALQTLEVQTPLTQSPATAQTRPFAQR
jgi:hypothetical protein